jgi:putative SOS response-associated peptidase YedK
MRGEFQANQNWGSAMLYQTGPSELANPVEGEHLLYGFLTTEANEVVSPIHEKAMPAILTTKEEYETWLHAPWPEASALQRPLQSESLIVVSRGSAEDE